jgi:TadE-like protein
MGKGTRRDGGPTAIATGLGSDRRNGEGGQALVEFALALPLALVLILFAVDIGRYVYTYSAISAAVREGARLIATEESLDSDCYAIALMEQVGKGFPLTVDPHSLVGNSDPNNPTGSLQPSTPPTGAGFIYIWPAVATAVPQETNCNGTQRGGSQTIRHVAVQAEFNFVPVTPLISQLTNAFVVKTISVIQVEY